MDLEITLRTDGTEHRLAVDTRTAVLDQGRPGAACANVVAAIEEVAHR